METRAFAPLYAPSAGQVAGGLLASTTVSASTASTVSTQFSGSLVNGMVQIQISNTTSAWAYVNFGVLALGIANATTASSYPIAPGSVVVVSVNSEVTGASVILSTGSGNVIFTRGEGL